ncbi:MAG: hypothetical protein KQ78_01779 [Candidatus Izimaplasma bacterium HR2]|nr:MAG: hypothetical protein KQ78_01779 [Candidatus Izimaplasma bacterium HR2]
MKLNILHELKIMRIHLKDSKSKCKSNRVKVEIGIQINKLTAVIEQIEREEHANELSKVW